MRRIRTILVETCWIQVKLRVEGTPENLIGRMSAEGARQPAMAAESLRQKDGAGYQTCIFCIMRLHQSPGAAL